MKNGDRSSDGRPAGPVVREMQDEDLAAVREIDVASLPRAWTEGIWRQELRSPLGHHLVVEEDGAISGYIGVKHIADELHVTNIAVKPERRRQGLARRLILTSLASFPDARNAYLEVRPSNAAARNLYESLGFVATGVRPRYYGDEDALLMTLDL